MCSELPTHQRFGYLAWFSVLPWPEVGQIERERDVAEANVKNDINLRPLLKHFHDEVAVEMRADEGSTLTSERTSPIREEFEYRAVFRCPQCGVIAALDLDGSIVSEVDVDIPGVRVEKRYPDWRG